MGKEVRGIPFVHGLEVLLVTVDDEVRTFMLIFELVVGDDTGKLEDAVLERVETTHLEIHPE